MTEQDWLTFSNPEPIPAYLQEKVSGRKLRLYGCACCRRIWHLLPNGPVRHAVELAEQFAEGRTTTRKVQAASAKLTALLNALRKGGQSNRGGHDEAVYWSIVAVYHLLQSPLSASELTAGFEVSVICMTSDTKEEAFRAECQALCALLRDIAGNPFRPTLLDPGWLTPTVTSLAAAAYEERTLPSGELDSAHLTVLADALEDAGCHDVALISHCRQQGAVHVRGCWVVDLLTGRS